MPVPLSVLDLFPVVSGQTPREAIHASIRLAKRVDELPYLRYWVAEHHNMAGIASAAPEVLITHVANATSRIRVGAGGIMVPNHSPLHVVEVFRTLEALFPDRIDLGLGRAPGTDPLASSALKRPQDVDEALLDLFAFADGAWPPGHPYGTLVAMPADAPVPPRWMLGSTQAGARIAASRGLGYAFAGHFSMGEARAAMKRYRDEFRPSPRGRSEPYAILALSVICATSEERARDLTAPLKLVFGRMARGERAAFPTVEQGKAARYTPEESHLIDRMTAGLVAGTPDVVKDAIQHVAEELGADEVMVSTMIGDVDERIASYELLVS